MDILTKEQLRELLINGRAPCLSFYLPTHRGGGQEDPVRWKNLLALTRERLADRGLRAPQARDLLQPAAALLEDPVFWRNQSDGLAFFLAPGQVRRLRLPVAFPERLVVADHFHVKPLLPLLGENGRFLVLALSQKGVRLFQGTQYGVQEIDLGTAPASLAGVFLPHDAEKPFTFQGRRAGEGPGPTAGIFHGHGVGLVEAKNELLHYFQKLDRALHPLLRGERAPLVLAGVDYLLPLYHQANTYPHLLEAGIEGRPDGLSCQQLHDRAWALVRPHIHEARRKAAALYGRLAGTGRTSANWEEAVHVACRGEVEALFVAVDRECWGTVDAATGQVVVHEQPEPGDEDLLNLAAVHTLSCGGLVYATRAEEVPGGGPAAAIFWLPVAMRAQ
jgi:hypothetical protein